MERQGSNGREQDALRMRLVWRDGPFRIECTGAGAEMRLSVHDGRHLMADEPVASVQAAWDRGTEICRELSRADGDGYETGSG